MLEPDDVLANRDGSVMVSRNAGVAIHWVTLVKAMNLAASPIISHGGTNAGPTLWDGEQLSHVLGYTIYFPVFQQHA